MAYELVQEFKQACTQNNVAKVQELLTKLKKQFIRYPSFLLTPRFLKNNLEKLEGSEDLQKEITLVKETLEHAILMIARNFTSKEAERDFNTNMNLLKKYYTTALPAGLSESPRKNIIMGLNLLRLLATNSMAEFHTELELIPVERRENDYIAYPIQLELYLMEGSYTKLKNLINKTPSDDFKQLMKYLVEQSVRKEIASCIEKSYESLRLVDLQKLLIFDSIPATSGFVQQQGWDYNPTTKTVNFKVNEPVHVFTPITPKQAPTTKIFEEGTPAAQNQVIQGSSFSTNNANAVIGRNFKYANEVNRII